METTIELPDDLLREADARAALEGVQLRDFIERGLRLVLAEQTNTGRRRLSFPLHRSACPGALTPDLVRSAEQAAAQQEDDSLAGAL